MKFAIANFLISFLQEICENTAFKTSKIWKRLPKRIEPLLRDTLQEESDLLEQPIEAVAQQKLDGISHLYEVYRAYLKNHIPNLV
jgi:mRNA-degrading endonuclease RelE of RelBE toxin-antitoxin system